MLTKNKIYLFTGNFQQIPRSLVVKQMDRESNANSKASVQGTVGQVDQKYKMHYKCMGLLRKFFPK